MVIQIGRRDKKSIAVLGAADLSVCERGVGATPEPERERPIPDRRPCCDLRSGGPVGGAFVDRDPRCGQLSNCVTEPVWVRQAIYAYRDGLLALPTFRASSWPLTSEAG